MTVMISAMVWLLAGNIITLFGLSDQAAVYCLSHLRTVALVNVILSVYVPLFGVFQGANHSGFPAVVATFSLTTRVLVTYASATFPLGSCRKMLFPSELISAALTERGISVLNTRICPP